MPCQWSFAQMMGYLNTWSAVKLYEQENGVNPLTLVAKDFEKAWGSPALKQVVFPNYMKAGKK